MLRCALALAMMDLALLGTSARASAQTEPAAVPSEPAAVPTEPAAVPTEPAAVPTDGKGAPDRVALAEARLAFQQGVALFREGRPAEARARFEASLAASPTVVAAWNLGRAWLASGRPLEGLEVSEAILAGRYGEPTGEQRAAVEDLRRELAERVATIELRAEDARYRVEVDEHVLGEVGGGAAAIVTRRILPGEHVLRAFAETSEVLERFEIEGGAARRFDLDAMPRLDRSGGGDPLLITLLTVGAVLVAGGAALAIGLTVTSQSEPLVSDPIFMNTPLP